MRKPIFFCDVFLDVTPSVNFNKKLAQDLLPIITSLHHQIIVINACEWPKFQAFAKYQVSFVNTFVFIAKLGMTTLDTLAGSQVTKYSVHVKIHQ